MKFSIIPVTPYQQNCSLVWCETTGLGAFIDPGGEADRLIRATEAAGVKVDKIILTHGHIDHVGAAPELARRLDVPIYGPGEDDAFLLDNLSRQSEMFGFPHCPVFRPDHWLSEGDVIQVGEVALEVLHCPGHTPGHMVLFQRESRHAFVGDVLFEGSIGRTDFPRGNHRDLIVSIKTKLFPLGDDIAFVPGHGGMSTFGEERRYNPFVGQR